MNKLLSILFTILLVSGFALGLVFSYDAAGPSKFGEGDRVFGTRIVTVDGSGGQDHLTIQSAVDAVPPGETILVYSGIYTENLVIDKPLTIVPAAGQNVIIDGSGAKEVVTITTDGVILEKLTVRNSGAEHSGVYMNAADECTINNCLIEENRFGIFGGNNHCDNNTFENNTLLNNTHAGIFLGGDNNTLLTNHIVNSYCGISLVGKNNTLKDNIIEENTNGVFLGALQHEVLHYGNSYTGANALETRVESLLDNTIIYSNADALSGGGMTLADHATNVETPGHQWNTTLTGGKKWDWVVLQDQSQIPGFPTTNSNWIASRAGAEVLNDKIRDAGAETVFLMTWGRRDGDSMNPGRYPNFTVMQKHLENGYNWYAENCSTPERPAYIAPVGLAFKHIHDEIQAKGQDPTNSGTLFYNLYSGDGSHPAMPGSYLASCVIYATITGMSPIGLTDNSGLNASYRLKLQQAAHATVFNETPDYVYPWETGRELQYSVNNTILNNSFFKNTFHGINVLEPFSMNNLIHYNEFWNNSAGGVQCSDNGILNHWDNGAEGNYWSDYTSRYPGATNNSVLWDTPYDLAGGALAVDNFPLVDSLTYPDYIPPYCNAGDDQVVDEGTWVNLNGTGCYDNVGIASYKWLFEYNGTDVELYGVAPSFYFGIPGNYTVALHIYDHNGNFGADHVNITVLTVVPPDTTPPFLLSGRQENRTVENGTLVIFDAGNWSDDMSEITNYTWSFEFGTAHQLLTGHMANFRFYIAGNYTVTLNVTNNANLSGYVEFWINVFNEAVPPVAEAGGDVIIDQHETVHLSGNKSTDNRGIINYTWSFFDIAPVEVYKETFHYTFHNAGRFLVDLNVSDLRGNWDTDSLIVTVKDITPPVPNAGGNITIKQRENASFNANLSFDNVGIVDHIWTINDRERSVTFGEKAAHRFDHAGLFEVILFTADAEGNNASTSVWVTVLDTQPPLPKAAASSLSVVNGTRVVFNANGSTDNVGVVNFTWTIGNTTLFGEAVSYIFDAPGTFEVLLTAYDAGGNNASKMLTIVVTQKNDATPPADDDVADDDEVEDEPDNYLFVAVFVIVFIAAVLVVLGALVLFIKMGPASGSVDDEE